MVYLIPQKTNCESHLVADLWSIPHGQPRQHNALKRSRPPTLRFISLAFVFPTSSTRLVSRFSLFIGNLPKVAKTTTPAMTLFYCESTVAWILTVMSRKFNSELAREILKLNDSAPLLGDMCQNLWCCRRPHCELRLMPLIVRSTFSWANLHRSWRRS